MVLSTTLACAYGAALAGRAQVETRNYEYAPGFRLGAVCLDGWQSTAGSQGSCSHHGGVAHWIYSEIRQVKLRNTFLARNEFTFWWIGHALLSVLFVVAAPAIWGGAYRTGESSTPSSKAHASNYAQSTTMHRPVAAPITPAMPSAKPTTVSHGHKQGELFPRPVSTSRPRTPGRGRLMDIACPWCGNHTVLSKRRRGGFFLRCSQSPKCRFQHDVLTPGR
jgi:hypothetical protein